MGIGSKVEIQAKLLKRDPGERMWTAKKVKIVENTIQLTASHGIDRVPISKIAKAAGVGEGTIFRHFKSKQDLLDTGFNVAVMTFSNYIRVNSSPGESLENRCMEFCKLYLNAGLQYPDYHSIIVQYSNCPFGLSFRNYLFNTSGTKKNLDTYTYLLAKILIESQKKRLIKDQPIESMACTVYGILNSLLLAKRDGRVKLDNELIQHAASSCWESLRKMQH